MIWLLIGALWAVAGASQAAEKNITLDFKPSASDPGNNKFNNTTPLSGICSISPGLCNNGMFSVAIPITVQDVTLDKDLGPRHQAYQSLDATYKDVTLTNSTTGETQQARFRLRLIALRHIQISGNMQSPWVFFNWAGQAAAKTGPCPATNGTTGMVGVRYNWAWMHPEGRAECYSPVAGAMNGRIEYLSVGYEMLSPNPLGMANGEWIGSVTYTVGNQQQIDVGEGDYSDNTLTFNIRATVTHQFNVEQPPGSNRVELAPPGGWEAFIDHGRLPQKLEHDVPLWVTTSGPFRVSLVCEYNAGRGCGIASALDGQVVPVRTGLTLPGVESGGTSVSDAELNTRLPELVQTKTYGFRRLSHVHFSADAEAVRQMAQQRGTQWRGGVTVIFDADI